MENGNFVKVILPIAVDKEFDYSLPSNLRVEPGMRVLVDFKGKKKVAIVMSVASKSVIRKVKPVIDILDETPSLSPDNFRMADALAEMYPYPRGEFIFMMLVPYLRKPRKFSAGNFPETVRPAGGKKYFFQAGSFCRRYDLWKPIVEEKLNRGSVIICFPQLSYLEEAQKIMEKDFSAIVILHSRMKEKELFQDWQKTRSKSLILGTRAAMFYYPLDLDLMIIEEENSPYYFQEERPYYHLPDVAFLFSKEKHVDLILSSEFPSLLTYKLIREGEISLHEEIEEVKEEVKNIKVIDISQYGKLKIINPLLGELLRKNIEKDKMSIVFWNKKGFARVISCSSCGHILRCDNCSVALALELKEYKSVCFYCGKKADIASICPECGSGYIKQKGIGIERMEAILRQMFPDAKIDNWQSRNSHSQIVLSTSGILSHLYGGEKFDAGFLLDVDMFVSRMDYQATFDTFIYIKKLLHFLRDYLYIFTNSSQHYLFRLLPGRWQDFYEYELNLRKEFNLPPFGFIAGIVLRAKKENNLLKKAQELYNNLKEKQLEVYGPFKDYPFKLRGSFRYLLIVKSGNDSSFRQLIKEGINGLKNRGIKTAVSIQ